MEIDQLPKIKSYSVVKIKSKKQISGFINLPWKIYKNYPHWIPPLKIEIKNKLNRDKHPFYRYGKVELFGVYNNNSELLCRCAAIVNPRHNKIYSENTGFFGLFECINDIEVAQLLMKEVKNYLAGFDCKKIIGPMNFTSNDEVGFLVNGFDDPPMIMSNYCPDYYNDLMISCKFRKEIDLLSYSAKSDHPFPEKYDRLLNRVISNNNVKLYPLDKKKITTQSEEICQLYNSSFKDNNGFVPPTQEEMKEFTNTFVTFADPKLIWIAKVDDNPVGCLLALPNINEILGDVNGKLFPIGILKIHLNRKKIRSIRVLVLCVDPKYRGRGIESLLISKCRQRIIEAPYPTSEFSMVLENNYQMRRILERIGFKLCKRYRIYSTEIL